MLSAIHDTRAEGMSEKSGMPSAHKDDYRRFIAVCR